ncbi:uncharacterized protein LOC127842982 isoform X2 [Dreissena polymorpha]|uniref:uncharacterized protein LOC127842982 isoform X2 n=1 Tax=Dreissena polymorpha TaxID=45954 RepID=UPI002263C9E6|nr:uncharacterized protein LOC127842982 isoform X2 [Dreissena polymorpha]
MSRTYVLPVRTVSNPAQSDVEIIKAHGQGMKSQLRKSLTYSKVCQSAVKMFDTVLEEPPDFYIRLVLLGDGGTGKSRLAKRFSCNTCRSAFKKIPSSVDLKSFEYVDRIIKRENHVVLARLYDTAGQEKFRSLTASYYRGAHGCLLLFDVTNETTFKNVAYWLYDLREHSTQPDVCTILVGTRCHVPLAERAVSTERAEKFAESEGLTYMEISAEEGINVMEVFEKMADLIIAKLAKAQLIITQPQDTVKLPRKPTQPKKEICSC